MTNSAAASDRFGVSLVSGAGGVTTMNGSVAGPTETDIVESKNGAAAVLSSTGRTLSALLVAILLT